MPASWTPGTRAIDETTEKLEVEMLRQLLESPHPLPEAMRWLPTRWLMKAVHDTVRGERAALKSLSAGLRSASDNDTIVLNIYRKMTGEMGSSASEVSGTGSRARARCERSYVFSAQLRQWLHEIPAFVQMPSGCPLSERRSSAC